MNRRKEINDKIITWIINKVKAEYVDDISLVLIYGSHINGTANEKSDVDCYFIPKTERGYELAVDFMIDGVGYDVFPMSWERVEKIADLQESLAPLLGDAQIVFCNHSRDLEHFKALQERMRRNLADKQYVRGIAVGKCEQAGKLCAFMNVSQRISDVRKFSGMAIMMLAEAIAVYHHDYYHFGLKKQWDDLQNNFLDVPKSIIDGYKNVVEADSISDIREYAMQMLMEVYTYLSITIDIQEVSLDETGEVDTINAVLLARMYEEISSTFNKIYICCENGNYILAFLSAVCLQCDLDEAREAGCPAYDLLGVYKYTGLERFSETTRRLEIDFVQFITENGGHIKRYDNFEQFELAGL